MYVLFFCGHQKSLKNNRNFWPGPTFYLCGDVANSFPPFKQNHALPSRHMFATTCCCRFNAVWISFASTNFGEGWVGSAKGWSKSHTCHHPDRNVGSKIESVWFEVTFPNIECCQHCVGSPRRTTYVSQVVILDKFLARQACKSIYLGIPSFSSSVPGAPEIPDEIAVQVDCQPPMMFWAGQNL